MEPKLTEEGTTQVYKESDISSEDAVVQGLGYEQKYRRVFGMTSNLAIIIIFSCPMFSDLIVSYYPVVYGGYWGLTWGWLIPVILLLPLPLAIAELCSSMPINGSLYWWTAALAPPSISRPVSFISGWATFLSNISGLSGVSYGVASTLSALISTMHPEWTATGPQKMAIAMAFILLWAFLNFLRMEALSIVFMTIATVQICEILVFIIGIPAAQGAQGLPFNSGRTVFTQFSSYSDWDNGVSAQLSFLGLAYCANGWYIPSAIVEETRNARVTAPRAILAGFGVIAIFGWLPYLVSAFCITDMEEVAADPSGLPLYGVILSRFGQSGGIAFLMVIMVFQILGGGSAVFGMSSSLAAFARDGGLPFPKLFSYVHPSTNMPLPAIVLVCAATIILLLVSLSAVAGSILYSLTVIVVYVTLDIPIFFRLFAGERFVQGPFNLGKFSWALHAWAMLITTYIMILACFPLSASWTASTFNYDWVVAAGAMALAGILWFTFGTRHYKGLNLDALTQVRREMDEERRRDSVGVVSVPEKSSI